MSTTPSLEAPDARGAPLGSSRRAGRCRAEPPTRRSLTPTSSAGCRRRPDRLDELWRRPTRPAPPTVGDAVHLRGLIEISNHCVRHCGYCGLRAGNATSFATA